MASSTIFASTLRKHQRKILGEWVQTLHGDSSDGKKARISPQELTVQAEEFLQLLTAVVSSGSLEDRSTAQFKALQEFLESLSRSRVQQSFSSAETATFIFSFKKPLFA